MNYFNQATLGFDKVTQSHKDLWDAAVDATIEEVQANMYGDNANEDVPDLDRGYYVSEIVKMLEVCKSDGAIDSANDPRKILPR